MFQSEPFDDEYFMDAISEVWEAVKKFNPAHIGLQWDTQNPRIQLEPLGERGYIELIPVK